ncbi:phage shock protein C (PspC) family protein [Brevibacterium sp. 239c]|uniref:PspC domain-containing protein n=1 Tax=Brevibacterium sp. 239c TaxID=1965356 RepID=UPI000C406B1E|nr:PspC domain-containing protein [Brevibacterium sp. 239c]SMY04647.1 phage shock protein C (PspC) family protein [Brevibacterium sp. 239c]
MNQSNTVMMRLSGHQAPFPLTENTHAELQSYLAISRDSLTGDVDRDEIIRDIEASIGDHLAETYAGVINGEQMTTILSSIGPVVSGNPGVPALTTQRGHLPVRRLQEGKWLTGVLNGIAAARGLSVYWVRGIYVAISFLAGSLLAPLGEGYPMLIVFGVAIVAYLIATLVLAPVGTREEYILTESAT